MAAKPKTLVPADLAGMDLFLGLASPALAQAIACARVRHLARDAIVFAQGEAAERCHALIRGRIRISQSSEDGAQLVVRFVGPGEMFGTMALFTDRQYPAEAVSVVDSIEISWTEAALFELIHAYPQIAINIVKIVGARLREVQERLRELATQRVERRLAHVLLRLANQAGEDTSGGTTIDFPLTRKDVAAMCGATLYTASRILTAWQKAEFIKTSRRRVTIRNLAAIRRLAGDPAQIRKSVTAR